MSKRAQKLKRLSILAEQGKAPKSDEFGHIIVDINVSSSDSLFSPLSLENEPIISQETAEFLSHSTKHIENSKDIKLAISSNDGNLDQPKLKRAIRNYYIQELTESNHNLKRNSILSIVMTIIGILVFAANILLSHFGVFEIITTVLDVVAWVFVWEAVDIFFFRRAELKHQKLKSAQLLTAEVETHN